MAKILVIDDDAKFNRLVKIMLEEKGFEVDSVFDGETGVERAKVFRPDLVLVDIVLPGINGIETCRQIKKIEDLKTKVIVITGEIDAVDVVNAREAGADDFCVKTTELSDLIKAIQTIL